MSEEVKEILDYFKTFQKTNIEQLTLNQKRVKQLLDYITTLQEENKNLKISLQDRIKQSEELDNLINRKDNAIELINKALNTNSDYVEYEFGTELLRQELLDILEGKEWMN